LLIRPIADTRIGSFSEHLRGNPNGLAMHDHESCVMNQALETPTSKEAKVSRVENAASVVVEKPEQYP
jgi:hypothetical protein